MTHTKICVLLVSASVSAGSFGLGCADSSGEHSVAPDVGTQLPDTSGTPDLAVPDVRHDDSPIPDLPPPEDAQDVEGQGHAPAMVDADRPDDAQEDAGGLDVSAPDAAPDLVEGDQGGSCGDARCDADESCTSCPRDCGSCVPVVPVFVDAPMPTAVQTDLSCHVPAIEALVPEVQASLQGADVSSVVGVDPDFAGIGAKFELHNNAYPNDWVNVLEPRSGAGAGWQTSFLVEDWSGGAGIIVFNQAAGNAVGYQWGYGTTIATDGQNLAATTLNPLPSDHIHATTSSHSPCEPSGFVFDDGAVDIAGSLVQTAHGAALAWRNRFRYRSQGAQGWPSWSAEQAFYLSRSVARAGDLRLYLVRGSTHHGPVAIYDPFSIPEATCVDAFCNTGGYDYAVLVWTIRGLDIGVALPDLSLGTSVNLEQTVYCGDANDDACGNINIHSWLASGGPVSYDAGQVRDLSQVYYVGTLPQLADLGFSVW